MNQLLKIEDFSVSYGRIPAVLDVAFAVEPGRTITIIGPNGAGKTTLLKGIMGVLPASGKLLFEGKSIARMELEERVRAGISLVPESRELFGAMSVSDNLLLGGNRCHWNRAELKRRFDQVYERFPRLAERRTQQASTLSGGERQMLALGRALMAKPKLLMLDEPSLGLAPLLVKSIFKIITSLRSTGVSILLVEQNARAALDIADYGYVLENGQVRIEGEAAELSHDERVLSAYMGTE